MDSGISGSRKTNKIVLQMIFEDAIFNNTLFHLSLLQSSLKAVALLNIGHLLVSHSNFYFLNNFLPENVDGIWRERRSLKCWRKLFYSFRPIWVITVTKLVKCVLLPRECPKPDKYFKYLGVMEGRNSIGKV